LTTFDMKEIFGHLKTPQSSNGNNIWNWSGRPASTQAGNIAPTTTRATMTTVLSANGWNFH